MATINLFTIFCLFIFFLPHITSKKCHQSTCSKSNPFPIVRFPFRLNNHQPPHCGYSNNFDLSCNEQKQTVLTLPSSSGNFTVEAIEYRSQGIYINDQNNCFSKRLLENDFNLSGSPFRFESSHAYNYTFFNCTPQAQVLRNHWPIACLSSGSYKVVAIESSKSILSSCNVISVVMSPVNLDDTDLFGVWLTWRAPDCRSCEASGGVCGFKDVSNLQLHCSPATQGLSNRVKFRLVIGFAAPGLVFITGLVLYIFTLIRDRVSPPAPRQSSTELSVVANEQQPHGLDDLTIESYPKTLLGERWEFPEPDDSSCPICLCEYKSNETLRSIPECNHHFHSSCIDEWLRKNSTCPVCRKTPSDEDNKNNRGLSRHEH